MMLMIHFTVEYKKGENPRLLLTGSWAGGSNARLALSPNAEVIVIAHGTSLSFFSALTGALDIVIADVFNGELNKDFFFLFEDISDLGN